MVVNKLLTLIILLFILGVWSFWIGFHNVDVAFNLKEDEYDKGTLGRIGNRYEVYDIGTNGLFLSQILFLLSFILFIIYI